MSHSGGCPFCTARESANLSEFLDIRGFRPGFPYPNAAMNSTSVGILETYRRRTDRVRTTAVNEVCQPVTLMARLWPEANCAAREGS